MNILRLLLLAAIAWLVWRALRGLRSSTDNPRQRQPPSSANHPSDPIRDFERIRACSTCGTEVPQVTLDARGRCRDCVR